MVSGVGLALSSGMKVGFDFVHDRIKVIDGSQNAVHVTDIVDIPGQGLGKCKAPGQDGNDIAVAFQGMGNLQTYPIFRICTTIQSIRGQYQKKVVAGLNGTIKLIVKFSERMDSTSRKTL